MSDTSTSSNIYEEYLNEDTTLDLSCGTLTTVPEIYNDQLSILYLQNNQISCLPDEMFLHLPNLMYLDLRDNQLTDVPKSIRDHAKLTHLLLQNNKLSSLPNELGTVTNLKVLQLAGNPLMYPPREIISAGVSNITKFLKLNFLKSISDDGSGSMSLGREPVSYNSVIHGENIKTPMSIKVNEKESEMLNEENNYAKTTGKCPKLAKSRIVPSYSQSSKYLKPLRPKSRHTNQETIKQRHFEQMARKKHQELLEMREKILQGRKNLEALKNWRRSYTRNQYVVDNTYKMNPKEFPYDTHPDYMTLLTREDIEKDLPDKYRKKLFKRCKPSVPRKSNNDVHLALKIKQLFENLEAIDLNRKDMTPRTEQKTLMNEIHKISEIKQKLMELSSTNAIL